MTSWPTEEHLGSMPGGCVPTGESGYLHVLQFRDDPNPRVHSILILDDHTGFTTSMFNSQMKDLIADYGPITRYTLERVPMVYRPSTPEDTA